jgi:hypothetical protein
MERHILRRMLEMAYLYAWGTEGSSELRDEFHILYSAVAYRVGSFVWDGQEFLWS